MARMGVDVSRRLKGELAWATDNWLEVISNIMLFKTVLETKELSRFKLI